MFDFCDGIPRNLHLEMHLHILFCRSFFKINVINIDFNTHVF